MWSSNGFTVRPKLQAGKDHKAVSPDEATLCLAADFFSILQWQRGLQRSACVMPNRLAVQLQIGLTSLLDGSSETCLLLDQLKHNITYPSQTPRDLKHLQTSSLRQAWHLILPPAELSPLPAPLLHLCDTGRQRDSQVDSSSLTCWWLLGHPVDAVPPLEASQA